MTFDDSTAEQQDLLFYALNDAREAVREGWLMELGVPIPANVELVLAQKYVQQLRDPALS